MRLFRNNAGKGFEDKTAAVGLDKEKGVFLTASWVDLDQDGDLDLLLARYAADAPLAVKHLKGEKGESGGQLVVYANVGVAPPAHPSQPTPPLSTAFKPITEPEALARQGRGQRHRRPPTWTATSMSTSSFSSMVSRR